VTDRSYRGKWLLVYFGFTSCPNSCPATLLEMAVLLEQLGPDADRLQPLFISVDPERDTPDLIRAYTGAFDPRIVGLSGSPEQIAAAAKAYGAYYVPHRSAADAADYVIDHSSYLYLMAPDGAFVRGFDGATPAADIAAVLRPLMRQTQRPGADRARR
jgi:protein SCO1/2